MGRLIWSQERVAIWFRGVRTQSGGFGLTDLVHCTLTSEGEYVV